MVRHNALRGIAAAVPVAIFLAVYSVYWPPDVPLIGPDSGSYLGFSPTRVGGYPFFLDLIRLITTDTSRYVIAQYVLYGLSVLLLAWQLLKSERNLYFCLLAEIGLLANWEVNRYHFSIISESLFLSIGLWFLAAAMAHLRGGSLISLAAAAAAAAASFTVRITGLAYLAALLPLLLAARSQRSLAARLVAAVLPIVVVLWGESLYYHAY